MSIKGKANIVGVFEHPTRKADDKSLFQLHAECAQGALADAGLCNNFGGRGRYRTADRWCVKPELYH